MDFIGRKQELQVLNELFEQNKFQLFVLYGRRRVGKTTLLNEFCKNKQSIFYSAEQSNNKLNLEKFSALVFEHYGNTTLEPFSTWTNALTYIDENQKDESLILVLDEFPYLAKKNKALLSEMQHLIDHRLKYGKLFIVLCGSYMGFMEKEILGSKSPLFGRRTAQLQMKPFDYITSFDYLKSYSNEEKLEFYGAYGGTPLYLEQIEPNKSFEENIKDSFLKVSAYLYKEPTFLLRQEVQEPGIYSAIIEAIAGGASKSNEIATKIGEESAKCLKYIKTLCELGILYKETPFEEKASARKTIYCISDFMFKFWYRYVFPNQTLIETGAIDAIWKRKIKDDYSTYMGKVFEQICKDYLLYQNAKGNLPILFTSIGRWWGNNPSKKDNNQVEIDLIAKDDKNYIFCECKWKNELFDLSELKDLLDDADVFSKNRQESWYFLFSKSGFTKAVKEEATKNPQIKLIELNNIINVQS